MRKIMAATAAVLAMLFVVSAPASAGMKGGRADHGHVTGPAKKAHVHSHRCRHVHRHAHRPRPQHSVMYYHAEPRRSWHAYRYYSVPYYAYRPYYYSAGGYSWRHQHWRHRHW